MKRAVQNRLPPEAREAIRTYLSTQPKEQAVSVHEAISDFRNRYPVLAISDAAVADCVAGTAITLDLMIAFDTRSYGDIRPTH